MSWSRRCSCATAPACGSRSPRSRPRAPLTGPGSPGRGIARRGGRGLGSPVRHPFDQGRPGQRAWDAAGPVPDAIRRIAQSATDMVIWADLCLCEYTSHGHCGVLCGDEVDNDATLPLLARAAVVLADAGADVIAPSDMMDGRVAAIRAALDEAGHSGVAIVSYAAKYASAFYGPFREAAGSTPQFGDRRGYQMDPGNVREAVRECEADIAEGADVVMVKPGMPYLDVIRAVRERVDVPVAAYQVSGEFAMLHAAAERGWLDLDRAMHETALALRRAGADMVITYFARELARGLRQAGTRAAAEVLA
ncbi:MAG: porphobilinogen synthase [Vicinamibacterales bacterium]